MGLQLLLKRPLPIIALFSPLELAKKGGGTATITTDALCCRSISFDDFTSFEYHAIVLKCQPPALTVTVYRPPKQCRTFLTDFSELLSIIHTNYGKILIIDDFNIHGNNFFTFTFSHLADAFIQSDLQGCIHIFTFTLMAHTAHQEQLGVQCLAQRHFDNRTSNLLITKRLLYPLYPLYHCRPTSK